MNGSQAPRNNPSAGARCSGEAAASVIRDLSRDSAGRLVLVAANGDRYVGVVPLRTFPITEPDGCIALLTEDGDEVAFLDSLADLPAQVVELLRQELTRREFVPIIQRIVATTDDIDLPLWRLTTDRGETETQVHVDDGLRRLGERGLLVIDIHGLRFLIPDTAALDAASRRILDRYL
jgi:hypothetical protein